MSSVALYVIAERGAFPSDDAWLDALARLAGSDVAGLALQVRTKGAPTPRAEALAREARLTTRGSKAPVLLNGSSATARRLGYDGVHWPEALLDSEREVPGLLTGASVHSRAACLAAEAAGADFLVAGAVFAAKSKPQPGRGVRWLRDVASATRLPVLAIGGITPARVAACIAAGASGVASVSEVLGAPDPVVAVHELRRALHVARALGKPA
jgi:thiamine-phosphate pyrophosphorylase